MINKLLVSLVSIFVLSVPAFAADWKEVKSCVGYDLCLEDLVAAKDLSEPDTVYHFPYHLVGGVVLGIDRFAVSPNCSGFLAIDGAKNLICTPYGNKQKAFVVARKLREEVDSSDPSSYITFDFKNSSRVKLFKDITVGGSGSYFLIVQ